MTTPRPTTLRGARNSLRVLVVLVTLVVLVVLGTTLGLVTPAAGALPSSADPFGNLERLAGTANGIEVAGWAIDPSTSSPIYVWVSVDGAGRHLLANGTRSDVASAYPDFGADHGFAGTLAAAPGAHRVCVTASNVGAGSHRSLGCRSATVPDGSPFGNVERVAGTLGGVEVSGWAIDPSTWDSIYLWVTVDGVGRHILANRARSDVASALPAFGAHHGFSATIPAASGARTVCVTASNVGPGTHRLLGCRTVDVPSRDPFGNVERVVVENGRIIATGWAIDPDTPGPIITQMYVDGRQSTMTWANRPRPDVGAVYPAFGPDHGFTMSLEVAPGAHQVCVYAINIGAGTTTTLSCRTVSGPPFFVYGSLRSGQSAYSLLAGKTTNQVVTRMPGLDLYRLSGNNYPFAVPNSANTTGIVGERMDIAPAHYDGTLAALDRYERYDPSQPPDNQIYVRELRPTREGVPSWVYVAGPRQAQYLRSSGILISSGDFLRW